MCHNSRYVGIVVDERFADSPSATGRQAGRQAGRLQETSRETGRETSRQTNGRTTDGRMDGQKQKASKSISGRFRRTRSSPRSAAVGRVHHQLHLLSQQRPSTHIQQHPFTTHRSRSLSFRSPHLFPKEEAEHALIEWHPFESNHAMQLWLSTITSNLKVRPRRSQFLFVAVSPCSVLFPACQFWAHIGECDVGSVRCLLEPALCLMSLPLRSGSCFVMFALCR